MFILADKLSLLKYRRGRPAKGPKLFFRKHTCFKRISTFCLPKILRVESKFVNKQTEASFCVGIRQKFDLVTRINPFHSRVLHERFHLISMSIFHLKLSPKTCFALPSLANNAPTEWEFDESPNNPGFVFARNVGKKTISPSRRQIK